MRLLSVLLCMFSMVRAGMGGNRARVGFVVEYFTAKGVRMVTSTLCGDVGEDVWLNKKLSEKGIAFDRMDLRNFSQEEAVERLSSKVVRLGVLVDLKCSKSSEILEMANKNHLFTFSRSLTFWMIISAYHISNSTWQTLIEAYKPEITDPMKFLMTPYESTTKSKYLMDINAKVNKDFLENYQKPVPPQPSTTVGYPVNQTEIYNLFNMDLMLDNEVALASPGLDGKIILYDLFALYKANWESKPKVYKIGEVSSEDGKLRLRKIERKRDLDNGWLRTGSAVFQPEAFTTIDDLATREADIWSKMTYPHVKLLAEDLNFRIVIRYFDDYGWQTNGTFSHLIGQLQQKKIDLSATGMIMRLDRLDYIDYMGCPFRLQIGVLFREPSLSSVKNIFVLPFSRDIWVSIGVVVVLTLITLRFRAFAGKNLIPTDKCISSFLDSNDYVVGALCQQGFPETPKSPSARIAVLILLLTSVALFTSYSACIVALLQSSSSAILSVADLTASNFEVGIQSNFPLYKVMMAEAVHPTMKEFYRRKVLHKGENAFYERREGIEKLRTGMFAFEVELTAGYKLISEIFEEREKCGIKEMDLIPKPIMCLVVRKISPFKEIFNQRVIWQNEVGLFDRSWQLWVDQKPKCEMGRIGFVSVGLTEFWPPLLAFTYGTATALFIFLTEVFHNFKIPHLIFACAKAFLTRTPLRHLRTNKAKPPRGFLNKRSSFWHFSWSIRHIFNRNPVFIGRLLKHY